jgi:signal transduction histidine kinase
MLAATTAPPTRDAEVLPGAGAPSGHSLPDLSRSAGTPSASAAPMGASPTADRGPRSMSSRADLWVVGAATLATFGLACAFELYERLTAWTRPLEMWQLDEVPIALVALAVGLAWYAFRRAAEARAQLQLRIQAQAQALNLLAHNRELAQQLLRVQENERRTLARELHDELGQHCHAIRIEAAFLQRSDDPVQSRAAVLRTAGNAEALVNNVRSLLRRLRPAELDELGLVAALQALCESWEERSGVPCIFRHAGPLETLGENIDTAVYRVTQEALTNVMRHAHASQVQINLQHTAPAAVELQVRDDGRGFDPGCDSRGLGLLGAAERAAAIGGTLQIDSAPDRGTWLRLQLPLKHR